MVHPGCRARAARAAAWAQVDRATLTGIVKDPSDAVIPKAQVTVTSLATNVVATATTNDDGTYLVVNLLPGEYLVQVEAPGFQRFEQTVSLEIGARSRLDMSLRGRIDRRNGDGRRRDAAAQHRIGRRSARSSTTTKWQKLPLAIRNWDDLLAMVPGRAERSLHRAGRRHVVGPHRRRQRPRQPQPAEQLPARRRRQQQLLDQRAGADDADFAAVGGCD